MSATPDSPEPRQFVTGAGLLAGGLAVGVVWVYWPTFATLWTKWGSDPQYSHGYLVPLFSLYLLWKQRQALGSEPFRPSWWGLVLLTLGLLARSAGTIFYYDWLSAFSLLPCLAGLLVLVGGWSALSWGWPALAFLVFMVPLPYRLEVALAQPLQRIATFASTYTLQTLGFAAFSEGNVIRLGEVRIGVVEACSGLSMLVIFFALATVVILLIDKPWWQRLLIFASAAPIAVLSNVARITVTGILHKTVGSRLADLVFHDLAGWLMMPLALVLLWIELRLLAWLIVPVAPRELSPLALGRFGSPAKERRPAHAWKKKAAGGVT